MLLSVAINNHPARDVTELVEKLDDPVVEVVTDPSAHLKNPWLNAKRCWRIAKGEYHLVLEDDVQVCRDLLAGLRNAIEAKRGVTCIRCYSCYELMAEAFYFERAASAGQHWVQLKNWGGAQAVAIRTTEILDLLYHPSRKSQFPDNIINDWLLSREEEAWNTIPSLVNHGHIPSVHGNPPHTANMFIGEDASALEIDWNADKG